MENSTNCSVSTIGNLTNSLKKLANHVQSGSSTKERHIKEATKILDQMYEICHKTIPGSLPLNVEFKAGHRTPSDELESKYRKFLQVSKRYYIINRI